MIDPEELALKRTALHKALEMGLENSKQGAGFPDAESVVKDAKQFETFLRG